MRITHCEYYCDICGKKIDYPRYIHLRPKTFRLCLWGADYDLCEECFNSVEKYIRSMKKTIVEGE